MEKPGLGGNSNLHETDARLPPRAPFGLFLAGRLRPAAPLRLPMGPAKARQGKARQGKEIICVHASPPGARDE